MNRHVPDRGRVSRLLRFAVVSSCLLLLALLRSTVAAAPSGEGAALFAAVSPSIAYVTTPESGGSGVLFQDGYVLTNAHVVAPHESANVRFPNGTEIVDARVVGWDWLADIAVLRVGEVPGVQPLRIGDWRDLAIGADVYLIGYPGETEQRPTPTITRGLLSKFRPGGPARLTYIQSDARASGGTSGGAMVTADGAVVGIVELLFKQTGFTLALPASDVVDRARALMRGEDPSGLGDRRLRAMQGEATQLDRFTLPSIYEMRGYVLRPLLDGIVRVTMEGRAPVLSVYDEAGRLIDSDFGLTSALLAFTARARGEYYILARQNLPDPLGEYRLVATQPLYALVDPDDGKALRIGDRIAGNLDYAGDVDFVSLDLVEGQSVVVTATSVMLDARLVVISPSPGVRLATDSDSGDGLLGLDARVRFTAGRTGRYRIGIAHEGNDSRPGGYLLSIDPSAPARSAPGFGRITRGVLASSGSALVIFGGGSGDDLVVSSGCARPLVGFWATSPSGELVPFIPAAPDAVNARWEELYPFGIPANTSLVAVCDGVVGIPPRLPPIAPPPPPRLGGTPTPSSTPSVR
ncbi:MAG: serine protease [Dehalococcoidia bacterium]|nr:serine protease [Dehalococcoidia bacterium]